MKSPVGVVALSYESLLSPCVGLYSVPAGAFVASGALFKRKEKWYLKTITDEVCQC
jgi:hypothetical protein